MKEYQFEAYMRSHVSSGRGLDVGCDVMWKFFLVEKALGLMLVDSLCDLKDWEHPCPCLQLKVK